MEASEFRKPPYFIRFGKRRIDSLGGVERLQIGMILPFIRDTGIAQQLCHGFIQGIDLGAADCLQVKAGIAGSSPPSSRAFA